MGELEEILEVHFRNTMETNLEQLLKMEFPLIKNLKFNLDSKICNIQFDECDYSKEEVEIFINQFIKSELA